ncbi:MAG: hypothetical protein MJE63_13045 [Proteobacteria bacterium]|nr:hypothetical protein [Pseudomonadota bacterium]
MHKETNHTKIIDHSKELNKIHGYRLGTITTIELTKNRIWVDFPDNPFNKAILAQLGTPWISSDELTVFRDKVDCVKLEFLDNNPAKPVIRDLFYSVNQLNRSGSKPFEDKVVEVEADRIILKGKKEVIIQCGETRTIYQAEGSEIVHEAEQIQSSAKTVNRVEGGSILFN